ncbi:MAG: 16S rRNA (guanine(966)-N(2))-methyltransferase RsmD [Christensenellaceae bacterium]
MRVIAGNKRGIKLISPDGKETRPTTDKVREAIFGSIQFEIAGKTVLDLFAGSGAMGIEALSRGAAFCVFADHSEAACVIINKNIILTKYENQTRIVKNDYINTTKVFQNQKKFDIVFIDPPYQSELYQSILENLVFEKILKKNALVVVESESVLKCDSNQLTMTKMKRYGKTYVTYYRYGEN